MNNATKCSALLAAGAGAAVCITGGGNAHAAGVSATIKGTNGDNSVFNNGMRLYAFSKLASWDLRQTVGNHIEFCYFSGNGRLNHAGSFAIAHPAGVLVSTAMPGGFMDTADVPGSIADKYFAVQFHHIIAGTAFGWLHVVSSDAGGTTITVDRWGYEPHGYTIHTLGESVAAKKLGLADGTAKLLWSNANEDGISRYEAQMKDASGAWTAVSSDAAGAGHYSATVPAGATCRIVVEKVDGATEEIGF